MVDYGAGSTGNTSTVSGIARRSLKRPKHARALAALAAHLPSQATLELGTSLGLTSAYLARHTECSPQWKATRTFNPWPSPIGPSWVPRTSGLFGEFDATWEAFADRSTT